MENNNSIFRHLTLLIVEDDHISSEYLKEFLNQMGFRLIFVSTGEEAIRVFKEQKSINLVLMDIRLPGQNGYVTTQQLKKMNSNVPIIAQTAYALEGDREKSIDAGCDDYISKPIRQEELIKKIKTLLYLNG